MKTGFSPRNMEFTKRAHLAAQSQFYPGLFRNLPITFEDTVGTAKDLEYAIDCRVAVTVDGLQAPLYFAVQERWRRPADMQYGDITITEWNQASGQPSELHKLGAQLFVYGFYDETTDRIVVAVAVNVVTVLWRLAVRDLGWRRQRRIDQTFLGFSLQDLRDVGSVIYHYDGRVRSASIEAELKGADPDRSDNEWSDVVTRQPPDHRRAV